MNAVRNDNSMRLDAGESAFFLRELEYIKTKTYDVKYKPLRAFDLIPLSSEADNGANVITWRQFAAAGLAKIVSDYSKDFPRVDTYGTENTVTVKSLGASYGYSIQEIRASQRANKRLDQRRAEIARRAIDELTNNIALTGDSASGLQGLLNYPGITSYTVPNDGTGSSKTWANKTSDQIIRDVTSLVNAVVSTTYARELPDTLVIPLTQYNDIATRRISIYSDITVLQYLLNTSPYLKTITWLNELQGFGAGATDRMLCYVKDEMHVTLEMPQMFEQFEPQLDGMEYRIPCHARTGGVIVYYPLAIAYGDGI